MIDRDIQARAEAFRGNQPQLLQRFKQSNDLIDLLALQKLKSEKEAAVRDMQMQQAQAQQKQGGLPTIAQQREQQVMELTKGELLQQQQGVLAKKQADQQNAIRRLTSSGVGSVPAPNMARMMSGGIVGYQEGGEVDEEEARRALIQELLRQNREAGSRYLSEGSLGLETIRNLDAEDPVFTMEEMGYREGGPVEFSPYKAPGVGDIDPYLLRRYEEMKEAEINAGIAAFNDEDSYIGRLTPEQRAEQEAADRLARRQGAATNAGIAAFDDGNTFLDRPTPTPPRNVGERLAEMDLTEGMPPAAPAQGADSADPTSSGSGLAGLFQRSTSSRGQMARRQQVPSTSSADTFSQDYVAYLDTLTPKQRAEQEAADRLARRPEPKTEIEKVQEEIDRLESIPPEILVYDQANVIRLNNLRNRLESLQPENRLPVVEERIALLKEIPEDVLMMDRSSFQKLKQLEAERAELLRQIPEGQQSTPEEQEGLGGEPSLAAQDEVTRISETAPREGGAPADLNQFTVEPVIEEVEEVVDERNPITRAMGSLPQDKLDQLISFLGSAGTGTSVASALRTGAAGAQATKAEQAAIERALSEAAAERTQQRELTQLGLDTAEKQFLSGLLRETQQAVAMDNLGRDEAIGRLRGDLNRIVYEFTTTNPEYLDAARRKDTERMTALVTAIEAPIQATIASLESGKYDVTEAMKLLLEYYE